MKIVRGINISLSILIVILTILGGMYKVEKAEVIEVYENDVIFVTNDGNEWEFFEDGYNVGDEIKVVFNCKGTAKRTDDIILKIK